MSNLFVKAGLKKGEQHMYNFDLFIVHVDRANRVVNVINAVTLATAANRKAESEDVRTNRRRSKPPVLERPSATPAPASKPDEAQAKEAQAQRAS